VAEIGAPMFNAIVEHLAKLTKALDVVLSEEGNLVSPPTSPSKKKPKTEGAILPVQRPAVTRTLRAGGTETGMSKLGPPPTRRPVPKDNAGGSRPVKPTIDTEADSNMETDTEVYSAFHEIKDSIVARPVAKNLNFSVIQTID